MENGWTNVSLRYYKDRSGVVHAEGRIASPPQGGPHSSTIFTLPEGYRPRVDGLFVYSRGGTLGDMAFDSS